MNLICALAFTFLFCSNFDDNGKIPFLFFSFFSFSSYSSLPIPVVVFVVLCMFPCIMSSSSCMGMGLLK